MTRGSRVNTLARKRDLLMNWYYAQGGNRVGPIAETEFHRLVRVGLISADTLVWREGMRDWRPLRELEGLPGPATEPASVQVIRCSECGRFFAPDEVILLGGGNVCVTCKPIVVQKLEEGVLTNRAEQIRKELLSHEASVKSVGTLYLLGGLLVLLLSVSSMIAARRSITMGVLLLALGAAQLYVAFGLSRLKRWARVPTGIISGLGLLAFPLGTLINGYILYLIFSRKGATVFSEDYKQVIAETPHIKYRTSVIVWIFLGLVLILLSIGFFAVLWGVRR